MPPVCRTFEPRLSFAGQASSLLPPEASGSSGGRVRLLTIRRTGVGGWRRGSGDRKGKPMRGSLAGCIAGVLAFATLAPAAFAGSGRAIDPCALTTLAEVKAVFPAASASERQRSLEDVGIFDCAWKDASGARVVNVRVSTGSTAEEEIGTFELGMSDPTKPPNPAVRHEAVQGLGGTAFALVARRDAGAESDLGLIALQKGGDVVAVMTAGIRDKDKAQVLKDLSALVKAAAGRL